jgi:hypothetical protein
VPHGLGDVAVEVLLPVPWDAACLRGDMIEDKLEHLDPVAYLTASDADCVGQFFVRDWCFCRLVGHGGRLPVAKSRHLLSGMVKRPLRKGGPPAPSWRYRLALKRKRIKAVI